MINKIKQLFNKEYKEPQVLTEQVFSEEQAEFLATSLKQKQSKGKIVKGKYQLNNWRWDIGLVSTILHKRPLLDEEFLDFLEYKEEDWHKEVEMTTEFDPMVDEINEESFYYGDEAEDRQEASDDGDSDDK